MIEPTGRREVAESVLTAVLASLCAGLVDWALCTIRDNQERERKEHEQSMKKKPKKGRKM